MSDTTFERLLIGLMAVATIAWLRVIVWFLFIFHA